MKYEIIIENGNYALIHREKGLKEYAVVYKLDKITHSWEHTVDYYSYEYDGKTICSQQKCLFFALDCLRRYTEEDYISLF